MYLSCTDKTAYFATPLVLGDDSLVTCFDSWQTEMDRIMTAYAALVQNAPVQ